MKKHLPKFLALSVAIVSTVYAQDESVQEGVEVLTRGPMHEAFAAPVIFDPQPGTSVPKEPPAPIEEIPPEFKPDGENVEWIPGYWSWDDDRQDFVWVSGIWRVIPPDRQWVPGYWSKHNPHFRWVSGYWAAMEVEEVRYLPTPPANLEVGPSSEPPTPQHGWIPGSWVWNDARYAWRPGYWVVEQPGWTWVPAQYVWTPSGCVYSAGYWDYAPPRRGLIFAPVYVERAVYVRPYFSYRPSVVIDIDIAIGHSFCRPAYRHYYFGDYYAKEYFSVGIYPGFSFHYSRYGYDPIHSYQVVVHRRTDPNWSVRIRDRYVRLRDNADARPPRTYAAQQTVINNNITINNREMRVARSISQLRDSSDSNTRLVKVQQDAGDQIRRKLTSIREYQNQRKSLESRSADATRPTPDKPVIRQLRRSPVTSRTPSTAAPTRPTSPRPDTNVRPRSPSEGSPRPDPRIERRPRNTQRPNETRRPRNENP